MELLQPDRRQRLADFIDSLSIYERRAVLQVLQQQSFERDIVSGVPVELAELIFGNLDFTHVFTCRRVCRAWYNILQRPALERTVITEQCYMPVGSSAFVDRAAQIHRFRSGRPASTHQLGMPHGIYGDASGDVAFNASRFAVAIENDLGDVTAVEVWDFGTGRKSRISSPALQYIYDWTLSESTLFFNTFTGFLYAKALDDIDASQLTSVRLPSLTSHLWSRGDVVAFQSSVGIGFWSPLKNQFTDIPVPLPDGHRSIDALLIAESGEKVSAIFQHRDPDGPFVLNIQTYSTGLTPSLEGQLSVELPGKLTWHTHFYPDEISFSRGHPFHGRHGILSALVLPSEGPCRRLLIFFDQEKNTLYHQSFEAHHFTEGVTLDELLNKEFLFWNGVVYSVRFDLECKYDRAKSRPALIVEEYKMDLDMLPVSPQMSIPIDVHVESMVSHSAITKAQLCRIRKGSTREPGAHFDDVFISGNESFVLVHQKREDGHDLVTLLSFERPAKLPPGTGPVVQR